MSKHLQICMKSDVTCVGWIWALLITELGILVFKQPVVALAFMTFLMWWRAIRRRRRALLRLAWRRARLLRWKERQLRFRLQVGQASLAFGLIWWIAGTAFHRSSSVLLISSYLAVICFVLPQARRIVFHPRATRRRFGD